MEKTTDTTELTLRKPNAALVMMPKAGKLTGIERKLFNSILLSSISQLNDHRARNGADLDSSHTYSAPADELLDPIETGKSNLKSAIKKYMLSLRRAEVDWEAPDAKTGVIWSNTAVLPRAEMELRNGRLFARWKLSDELAEAIINTKEFPFTRLDLTQIAKLSSYSAVALYEICARYRNNFLRGGDGVCLTSASDPDWWVDALTNTLPKVDKKTGIVQRREWRKVKNEAVLKAVEEINKETDLEVGLIEKKSGKAVSQVQFSVRQKRELIKEVQSSDFEVIKHGARLGISQARVEQALDSNSRGEVELALARFESRMNSTDLAPVENKNVYFASILKATPNVVVVPDKDKPSKVRAQTPISDTAAAAATEKFTQARAAFMKLADTQKAAIAERALESLKGRRMASEKMIANSKAGVYAPLLLAEMVRLFGLENQAE